MISTLYCCNNIIGTLQLRRKKIKALKPRKEKAK